MTAGEIIKKNKLIAEFIGNKFVEQKLSNGGPVDIRIGLAWEENCKFHSSWDWLMPVVAKIEELSEYYEFQKENEDCYLGRKDLVVSVSVQKTFENVTEFLNWYKKNLKTW